MDLPTVDTWHDQLRIEPSLTDVERWRPAIRWVCERESITVGGIRPCFPSSSAAFILGGRLVLKILTPFFRDAYEVERRLLEVLAANPDIPAPELVAAGRLDDRPEWPYLVMEYIPGVEIRDARHRIKRANLLAIAEDFGRILHAFHHTPLDDVAGLPGVSWRACRGLFLRQQEETLGALAEKRSLEPNELPLPHSVLDELQDLYETGQREYLGESPVLVNRDLTEDHLILAETGGRWQITGLIDFADAIIGPRDFDWHDLWFHLWDRDAGAMKAFLGAYDPHLRIDREFRRRCMFFGIRGRDIQQRIQGTLADASFPGIAGLDDFLDLLWPQELLTDA